MNIVRCPSCDGYGWIEEDDQTLDCDWCAGVGYVYRDDTGVDRRIPQADLPGMSETLERLEHERMRDIGYTGSAKHPREQEVRRKSDS